MERVPRFASLKYAESPCRSGPTFGHPAVATFQRKGLPVLIVAETVDHWRKIRDVEGGECWVHKTALRGLTHVLTRREISLRASPAAGAPVRATLAAGVVARLDGDKRDWRKISASGINGWANAADLWGAEAVVAAHN